MVMVTKTSSTEIAQESSPPILTHSNATDRSIAIETNDLKITAACLNRIASLTKTDDKKDDYLRVYVDAGGCSGFQYKFELTSEALEEDDVVFQENASKVVVDAASLELLRGSTIDFVQEMIRSSFAVVENPQSESACGCGSSFAVKNFSSNPALD